MKYTALFNSMAKYKGGKSTPRYVEPAYDDDSQQEQTEQSTPVGGYRRTFTEPDKRREIKRPSFVADIRPEIIDRFKSESYWTNSQKDKGLMDLVWQWADDRQEQLGTEIFAKGLELAEESGELGEVQRTTYSSNFYRKMALIIPFFGKAAMDLEEERRMFEETQALDEKLANEDGFEDLSDEEEEFLNRFG